MRSNYIGPAPLQSGATATGNGTALTVIDPDNGAMETCTFHVEGITTATVTFEGTIDGTNWIAIGCVTLADESTVATTATADGLYRAVCAGLYKVRARISAYTSGTITVTAVAVL